MNRALRVVVAVLAVVGALAMVMALLTIRGGFGARVKPSAAEGYAAEWLRDLAMPRSARNARSPVAASPEVLAHGRRHFAEECAVCHGNDGRGSDLGKRFFPPVPDLRDDTGDLTDGEIFHVIENGIRWSAMPAFAEPGDAGEARSHWEVVQFVRHLPKLTQAEIADMERFNPRPPAEAGEHAHGPEPTEEPHAHGVARPPPAGRERRR